MTKITKYNENQNILGSLLVKHSGGSDTFTVNSNGQVLIQTLSAGLDPTSGATNTVFGVSGLTSNTGGTLNTAIGYQTLASNTSGGRNTALGHQALLSNTSGTANVGVGNYSLTGNTVGNSNTAVGDRSLLSNISGNSNTAMGVSALRDNTGGLNNTAMGVQALQGNTTGIRNTGIGVLALLSNTTGTNNTALGHESIRQNTIGSFNTAIGTSSFYSNVAGSLVTAIGYQSMFYANDSSSAFTNTNVALGANSLRGSTTPSNNIGLNNTGVGYETQLSFTSGSGNTSLGNVTLRTNTTGSNNTAIGNGTLSGNTTGSNNTAIGNETGLGITTGSHNTILGANVTGLTSSISNNIILADGQGNIRMHGISGGSIGFGTSLPVAKVDVSDVTGISTPLLRVQGSSGELMSVYDSLTGSLFSVNDISGLPVIEAFSDNTILMGNYQAPMLFTTTRNVSVTGSTTIYSIPYSAYTGAFIDYVVTDGTNKRAGSIMSIWDGTNIRNTEVQTTDIGNTVNLGFTMTISGNFAVLTAVPSAGTWTIKTIIKSI